MILKSVHLKNFRNYDDEEAQFCEGINVVLGENAQGKTNLLEALYYFAAISSFKGAKIRDMIKNGEDEGAISCLYASAGRDYEMKIGFKESYKKITVNGVSRKNRAHISLPLSAVLFAPEHLSLIKGAPGLRRQFVDSVLVRLSAGYAQTLQSANKVLMQKTALLKRIKEGLSSASELMVWNERLLDLSEPIVRGRERFVGMLLSRAGDFHSDISSGKEDLSIEYIPSGGFNKDDMQNALHALREREIASSLCLFGPHRDQINIKIDALDSRVYASQGQSRSAVIALKLAECAILKDSLDGEWPVLLLDDVLSELDESRRDYVLNHIGDMQVILSCCEGPQFGPRGRTLHIKHGKISEV